MLTNIYSPLSGALAHEKVLDIIANNLANANTVGFKEESVSFKLLEPEPEKNYVDPLPPANFKIDLEKLLPFKGNEMSYVGVSGVQRNYLQGSPINTHNPLDVLLEGSGFFAVNSKEGLRYSRNGSFAIGQDGLLTDQNGFALLGEKGTIFLNGKDVRINERGEIYQDGTFIDKLLVYDFKNTNQLEKVGLNHYHYSGFEDDRILAKDIRVRQGFLEASNVNTVKNLTAMIMTHRSYEAYQQAIKNFDRMMDLSSNRIGEVRA